MPKKGFNEIICILDRSGSMGSVASDAIGGFNQFLKDQKELPGEASMTIVLFDNEYEILHENMPINDVPDLNFNTYVPRGMTALLDAIGKTIKETGKRLKNTPEEQRPEKIIISILTDGFENSSSEYTNNKIKEMIQHQESQYNWTFIYLAAGQDAIAESSKFGINQMNAANYVNTGQGTRDAYNNINQTVSQYRTK